MLACALGGIARHVVGSLSGRLVRGALPFGTLVVNLSGALLAGLLAGLALNHPVLATPAVWQPLVIGFLGSYTTVSAFSLQLLDLYRSGQQAAALAYMALSLALCPTAVLVGIALAGGPAW